MRDKSGRLALVPQARAQKNISFSLTRLIRLDESTYTIVISFYFSGIHVSLLDRRSCPVKQALTSLHEQVSQALWV